MEPKIYKTLVHKETGEYGEPHAFSPDIVSTNFPLVWDEETEKTNLKGYLYEDKWNIREVVLLIREEYERLKEIERASANLSDGIKKFASNINNMKTNNI